MKERMALCREQKSVKQQCLMFSLRFFKEATVCVSGCYAHSWHPPTQLHGLVTWNYSPEEVPRGAEHLLEALRSDHSWFCTSVEPKLCKFFEGPASQFMVGEI